MNTLLKPRNIALAGLGATLIAFLPRGAKESASVPSSSGVKNIEQRFSSGGATDTHTPGAATRRGTSEDQLQPQKNPTGIDTAHFAENQASQRPGEPGPFDKAWNKSNYGVEKGK